MNSKALRNLTFQLHRYLGLAIGLVIIIIGLTGSLLIFRHAYNQFGIEQQFGKVIPQDREFHFPLRLKLSKPLILPNQTSKWLLLNHLCQNYSLPTTFG